MSLLSNALSGLNAANTALLVSGQNVSNATVEGYSRQAAEFGTAQGAYNGVSVISVDRIVNSFLNDDIWRTQSDLSHYEGYQTYLGYIEELVGTDSLNFNDAIANITNALSASMSNPESTAYRQELLATSEGLVQKIAQLNSAMEDQTIKLGKEMNDVAKNASSVLSSLAQYNSKIAVATAKGEPTAQLADARERLVTELSSLIGVSTNLRADGRMDISTVNGAPLVIGDSPAVITTSGTDVEVALGNEIFTLGDTVGGRLGGLIAVNEQILVPSGVAIDDIISQLADDVNNALHQGFDLNGDPGIPLFTYNATDPAGTFAVNSAMEVDKLAYIGGKYDAFGVWVPTGSVGDNQNIEGIIAAFNGQQDKYTTLVGDLATSSRQNQNSVSTASVLSENAVLARDSISAVNLDEEAANIMQFQQLYQANAKVISTADELFNTLLAAF
ncbi:flagellar hook-associated protein FlgK [Aestuariibacter sp. A3R04]|uniref:flagellar hook-associated protein FlgK n=1 Tax=Aestuariibacter sp. A3R04 TaxID=2841571 RepID=UPI001C084FFD|nr:flagellar hook-associated protein FlgK [Aestuariibacter sp. A3R04]MBU3023137.1 flagellar hook-associated protein FlgK [Aestuariibacter sp. A3R04]